MPQGLARRDLLAAAALAAAGGVASGVVPGTIASAVAETASAAVIAAALKPIFGDRPVRAGKVLLKLPVVAENGSSVSVGLGVAGAEMPRRIVVVATQNPQPLAAEIRFGPRAAKADTTMRLRLARSQTVIAAAEMADGSVWATGAEVVITSGACAEMDE